MAGDLNISTEKAQEEIEKVLEKLEKLASSMSKIRMKGGTTFKKASGAMADMRKQGEKLNTTMEKYESIIASNNKATNEAYSAARAKEGADKAAAKAIEALGDAYTQLVNRTKAARRVAQNLVDQQKMGSQATKDAIVAYQELQLELDTLNANVSKTKNHFEILKDSTKKAGDEAQNMAAKYGAGSDQARSASLTYRNLKEELDEATNSIKKSVGPYQALANSVRNAKMHAQNLAATQKKSSRAVKKATAEYKRLKKQLDKATVSTNRFNSAKKRSILSGAGMMRMLGSLMGALGFLGLITLLGKTIKSIISLTIRFESLGFALNKISGENFAEVKRSWEFLLELNAKFGASLSNTAERWLKFRAAAAQSNLTLVDTMKIFRSVTKASAVLGLTTHELQGVYLALEQMLSKGKVTTEELRRQLGERLPGAMGIMAKAIGVSVQELDGMLKKGEVLSSYALPRFAEALEEAYGITALDTVNNLATSVGKLTGAWDRFVLTISEGDSVISKVIGWNLFVLTKIINDVTNALESYNQTANRTSGAEYGKQVADEIKRELEFRLRSTEALKKHELALMKLADTAKKAGNLDEQMEAERKLAEFRYKNTEKYFQDQLKVAEAIANTLEEGDAGRIAALEAREKAAENLANFQQRVAVEGNELAEEEYENALAQLGMIEKERDRLDWLKTHGDMEERDRAIETFWILEQNYIKQLEYVKQLNEARTPTGGDDYNAETTGTSRRIKMAKQYTETNQLLINSLKEQIRLNEKLAKEEIGGLVERADMFERNYQGREMIAQLEMEDQLAALEDWRVNEEAKLEQNLTAHANHGANKIKQQAENDKQREFNKIEHEDRLLLIEQEFRLKKKQNIEKDDEEWREIGDNQLDFEKEKLALELAEHLKVMGDKMKTIRKGGNEEKKLLFEIAKIQTDYHNLMIDIDIKKRERDLEEVKTLGEKKRILEDIAKLESKKLSDPADDWENVNSHDGMGGSLIDPLFAADFEKHSNAAQGYMNEMFGVADAIFEHRIALIQKEIDAETARYDRLLELAKNDEEETKIIQRNKAIALEKLEAKKRREQIKQAKLDKALKISQAIQGTAVAVINMLSTVPWPANIAMAALVAAGGAAQIATIVATPIPSFAEGGTMKHDGKALINDGGRKEYVERDGQLLASSQKNAVVDLKKGDIIHKNFEELQRKSLILSLMGGGQRVSEKEFNLAFGIKEEIQKGFKKAQVLSNVTVINETNDYRNKMSMWN